MSLDAEVSELVGVGTLRIELEWVRAYPYLGTMSFAFVKSPTIDFKLSLGGSPDVMDLAPPLRCGNTRPSPRLSSGGAEHHPLPSLFSTGIGSRT